MRSYRIFVLMCTFLVIFLLLLGKIFYYQIVRGEEIAKQAASMRSKEIALNDYSRGNILDRNLLPLTNNHVSNALYCLPYEMARTYRTNKEDTNEKVFENITEVLSKEVDNLKKDEVNRILNDAIKKGNSFVRIANNLKSSEIDKINSLNIRGLVTAPIVNRYDTSGFCNHVLGYVSNSQENKGVSGIEKQYNEILRNSELSQDLVSITDARGRAIQGLMFKIKNEQDSHKGSVVMTIDKRIQNIVEKAMNKRVYKGAVVIIDVRSKEILAMASRPAFNPYDLPNVVDNNKESPLTNRAISCYHPGSLFKILVAAAAIEEGIVTLDDKFYCDGAYEFNKEVAISCWKDEGHGEQTFTEAFANSCNPSFIEVGLKLERDTIEEYANNLHLTDHTIRGWLEKPIRKSYVKISPGPAGIGNACLGQQGVMLTPVQITNLIATIADNGRWGAPSITKYTIDKHGKMRLTQPNSIEQVLSVETAKKVQYLMEQVVNNGTGKNVSVPYVQIAGKTGTSQTGIFKENKNEILNTWFGGYFPASEPKWAMVVMVEEGTSGAIDAAPVFKEIVQGMLELFSTVD